MQRSLKISEIYSVLFDKKRQETTPPLKPFAFKTRDGFLLGLATDPKAGSPCSSCVERWLKEREVWLGEMAVGDLPSYARELLAELLCEKSGHTFYEILSDGSKTRLDSIVFPHPDCVCNKSCYVPPQDLTKNKNYAFSPIFRLRCVRYGTPQGNLWLFTVSGQAPATGRLVTAFGVDPKKDLAKMKAIEQWMKKAAPLDLAARLNEGQRVSRENLITGDLKLITQNEDLPSSLGMGAGSSKQKAVMDALYSLTQYQTLKRSSSIGKSPMLVVGAHSWLRSRVPFFLLQQYDLHLMFYPTPSPAWVIGILAVSRKDTSEAPTFAFSADSHPLKAVEGAIYKLLEKVYPLDMKGFKSLQKEGTRTIKAHMSLWWTNWIYRCPKLPLKDILALEPYANTVEQWREYLKEKNITLSFLHMNHPTLPAKIKHLVKIQLPETELYQGVDQTHNVGGIGTWNNIESSLLS